MAKTEIEPPTIRAASDITVPNDGCACCGKLKVRKYVPATQCATAGSAILFLHGGGCVLGDLETHDIMCRTLCHDTGATVFALDYRLAPEHPFPTAIEDSVVALKWLSREAAALGVDPERIAIAGDSAGAGLAAIALHESKDGLAAPLRAQALLYPSLDLRGRLPSRRTHAEQFPLPLDMVAYFYEHYFGSAWPYADPRAMPVLYDNYAALPPALIITAGHDPLRDEGEEYGQMLAAAGVPVEYECYEGTIHGFMNMGRMLRGAHGRGRKRLATWLKGHLQRA